MKVDGHCHCGAIAYEAEVDPETVGICHCTDCQNLTGTAYRVSVPVRDGTFRLLRGTPRIYRKTTAESGTHRLHGFCPDCGSPVYVRGIDDPPRYSLRVGTIRQRTQLPPKRQIWCRSVLPWATNIGNLPGSDMA
jgi:hypothetical protein